MHPIHSSESVKSLSVVVPAFNEEHNIGETLRNIVDAKQSANHISYVEIIVVNDASTDLTLSIVEEFVSQCSERDSITILNCQRNRGVGHAFWMGATVASGEFITLVPGDGVFSRDSLANLFCDFSTEGITLTARKNKYQRKKVRRLVSKIIGIWFSWVVGIHIQDPHSLFVFPTEAVNRAYKAIWPSLKRDSDERVDFEYHLQILRWILHRLSISKLITVEVNTKLEKSSINISYKILINYLKHCGLMSLSKCKEQFFSTAFNHQK